MDDKVYCINCINYNQTRWIKEQFCMLQRQNKNSTKVIEFLMLSDSFEKKKKEKERGIKKNTKFPIFKCFLIKITVKFFFLFLIIYFHAFLVKKKMFFCN